MENKKLPQMIYSIEEFKQLFKEYQIDEEKVRFFIGKYHLGPKAFGIYEDNGEYIVYKVKDNGETVIRYQGNDETLAVKELYTKFLQEVSLRNNLSKRFNPYYDPNYVNDNGDIQKTIKKQKKLFRIILIIGVVIILSNFVLNVFISRNRQIDITENTKYYTYHDDYYSYYDDNYYVWDNTYNNWVIYYPTNDEYLYWDEVYYDSDDYYDDFDYDDYSYNNYDDSNNNSNNSFDFSSDSFTDWGSDW